MSFTARVERGCKRSFQACLFSLQGWGLFDLLLRATCSPAHPLARRDVPFARARAFLSRALREHRRSSASIPSRVPRARRTPTAPYASSELARVPLGRVAWLILNRACRTSTFRLCAFHEQRGQPGYPSFFCPILLSCPFHIRTILSLCLNQINALTSREKIKNSCLCSFTMATIGKHAKAASAPPDE